MSSGRLPSCGGDLTAVCDLPLSSVPASGIRNANVVLMIHSGTMSRQSKQRANRKEGNQDGSMGSFMTEEKLDDTLVAIATYNEKENLPRLVPAILNAVPAARILIIDDNSPDGTGVWCDEFASTDPRLKCMHRSGKLGLGSAAVAGIRHAIEHDYRLLVNLDADFSHPPDVIPRLIEALHVAQADVAIASRYMPGGKIEGWPWRRRLSSRMINALARGGLGLKVSDCSGSFRCYSVAALRRLDLDRLLSRGYAFYEEILLRLQQQGMTFTEVPFTFVERELGTTKLGYSEAVRAAVLLVRLSLATLIGR